MPVVELRVDSNLMCRDFYGYKLSFGAVPVLREDLQTPPSRIDPNWHDYSLLHGEVFSRHNHLCADPWIRHNTYFVNARHELMQCIYDPQVGRSLGTRVVHTVEKNDHGDGNAQMTGDYNYSMCFISERFCVICDGISTYHLLDTGDRSRPSTELWKLVTRAPVDREGGKRGYVMYDARLDVVQERKQISLVAGHISRREAYSHTYMDILWGQWIFNASTNKWEYTIRERLETAGTLQYCAFEPRAESLIMASNRKIETTKQHDEAVAAAAAQAAADAEAAAEAAVNAIRPSPPGTQNGHGEVGTYTINQVDGDVVIRFTVPENATSEDITIRSTPTTLEVVYLEQVLLSGQLYMPVNNGSMFWEVENGALYVSMPKRQRRLSWPQLLKEDNGDANADSDDDEAAAGPSGSAGLPIPNLEDPIEECDLGNLDEENQIVRFNLPKGEITHTIFLGNHPLAFVTNLRPGFPPAFVTRQGVDASVWLQVYQPSRPDEWSVRHEGQLHALGYVQASKENRKFTDCCPEFEYSVICENNRNVLIYQTRHDSAEGLRKRNGPQVAVGKQLFVTIDIEHGDIMGVTTARNLITILCKYALMHLQL